MGLSFLFGGLAAAFGGRKGGSFHSVEQMDEEELAMKEAKELLEQSVVEFEENCQAVLARMDALADWELRILSGFAAFAEMMEEIEGRPVENLSDLYGMELPEYDAGKLMLTGSGAGLLRKQLEGAEAGRTGRIAADGAVSLSLKATAPGGPAPFTGTVLQGIGVTGCEVEDVKLPEDGQQAKALAEQLEQQVAGICDYLESLYRMANQYTMSLDSVSRVCRRRAELLEQIMQPEKNAVLKWEAFSEEEKSAVQDVTVLISVLYKMCRVKLVSRSCGSGMVEVNSRQMREAMDTARRILQRIEATEDFEGEQVQAKLI